MDKLIFYKLNGLAGISGWTDKIISFFAGSLVYFMAGAVLLIFLVSFYPKFRKFRRKNFELAVLTGVSAILGRFGLAELIRLFYNRPRPFEYLKGVQKLIDHVAGGSFPSGHATIAFAIAAAMYLYYPRQSIWFWLAAILVGFGRITAGVHFPSDVLGGVLVGIFTVWLVRSLKNRFFRTQNPA